MDHLQGFRVLYNDVTTNSFTAVEQLGRSSTVLLAFIIPLVAVTLLAVIGLPWTSRAHRPTSSANANAKIPVLPHLFVFPPSTSKRLGITRSAVRGEEDERKRFGKRDTDLHQPSGVIEREKGEAGAVLQDLVRAQMPNGLVLADCRPDMRTPTDMTLAEVASLGDFPDYASLTGVPDPKPDLDFSLERSVARPYRPLRWKYVQNMSLMKLEPDNWLELTRDYRSALAQRRKIWEEHGCKVLDWRPGTELAAKETMEMALHFYCKRYPQYFQLVKRGQDVGWVFVNGILRTETIIKEQHPLQILFDNIPEEFMLTIRNPDDGLYYLRGGICCSAVGWTMAQKMDKPLAAVHEPVPDYSKNMAFSMDRFFAKMPTDKPIQRGSFEIKPGQPLFKPPAEKAVNEPDDLGSTPEQDLSLSIDDLTFRVDWQTLRRLPLSGAIVFNFRCLFTPITEFRDEPYMPALLNKILTESQDNLLKYKGTRALEYLLLPNLKAWAKEQEASGLVEPNWDAHTMDESPYFPAWQDKWRRQMGRL